MRRPDDGLLHPLRHGTSPVLVEFLAEVESLFLYRFLEQHFVCVAGSALEGVEVNGGGGSFRLPRSNYGTSSVYHPTLRLWAVPVLAAKLSDQGEMYDIPPLQLESDSIFVVYICVAFEWQKRKRDKVVAQQWGMCCVVQFCVYPFVVRAKSYGKLIVAYGGG